MYSVPVLITGVASDSPHKTTSRLLTICARRSTGRPGGSRLWAKRPTYLVALLRLAAAARPMPRQAYRDWFALSAARAVRRATRSISI